MNPYLFTITFLLLMGFLTSSEALRFSQSTLEHTCYKSSCAMLEVAEELRELSHLEHLRDKDNPDPTPRPHRPNPNPQKERSNRIASLRINDARPPDNSRLNLYKVLQEDREKISLENFSLYEVLAQLMRNLYNEELFFQEVSNVEYLIIDHLLAKKGECLLFTTPDQLVSVKFDNQRVQEVFYHMLKGSKSARSLLDFLTFNPIDSPQKQSRKINFLFAHPTLLRAIFPEGTIGDDLLARRERIWNEILDQEEHRLDRRKEECKGRREFKNDLKAILNEILTQHGLDAEAYLTHVFDYGLGNPGTVIFITDPLTGQTHRERYSPPLK
jgi:hypothetical protein